MSTDPISLQEIMSFLPHRYPFLLIDRIVEVEQGKRILAIKNVSFNEPHFQGHFPDHPVMPGVLILEAMAQAGALLAGYTDPDSVRGQLVYFMAIDKARFRKPVLPGHQLNIEMTLLKRRREVWRFGGKAMVDGEVACEAEVMAMTRKREESHE
ncbi:3-hydroxyacyl-[acyl-carrier-protein] dehydratase [Magnetococcus marinus MC-1]|uniref:3-hydroxyacyl-[acyl-carrier-protein] dehydratase FabZ n=1 Tax=Magnetococcus marinus (strain ATCC BAA-1437 / JCM 17883 / MC-1) TaxID=156889 RepID=FABZ_MAGMM|nr:3-hydroxyacyl-ACP dehydratase FabZ [Magnetococcus marinus]A0L8R5.1 RecName: Full=3-hydroxyacyl-[acyl-carrier-protein] dehydratase FabZ; AltName: Full=(3R)-hydroxymyristoyl-[acyl-carrier-protein] dehydratase; Short=(3R)-hydroxymyristoyl-ACP dehydrase; AltName: Full=Beta-hydroxyacyl-ACP dehydratase [Magnetococcus marinus MC-1]ABK44358.1 3-hydroxyacyl-[acyl-carrier-protein] dehydratase [Magnetococcus marinus MC-1]